MSQARLSLNFSPSSPAKSSSRPILEARTPGQECSPVEDNADLSHQRYSRVDERDFTGKITMIVLIYEILFVLVRCSFRLFAAHLSIAPHRNSACCAAFITVTVMAREKAGGTQSPHR